MEHISITAYSISVSPPIAYQYHRLEHISITAYSISVSPPIA